MFSFLSLILCVGCGSTEKDDTASAEDTASTEDTGSDESNPGTGSGGSGDGSGDGSGGGSGDGSGGGSGDGSGGGSGDGSGGGSGDGETGNEDTGTEEGTESDFIGEVTEGDWLDEAPTLESDNCGFAIEAEMYMTVSASTVDSFTITMDKENGAEEDTAFHAVTYCSFTPEGSATCAENEYLSMGFAEFFANEPEAAEMVNMNGSMHGSLAISGTFTDANSFTGTMTNTFSCMGADCAMMQQMVPLPCVIEKSFTVIYVEGEEAE